MSLANITKLAHIRMDFAGIMQTIGIKGRYVGFTYTLIPQHKFL